ncbi:MAG TPA: cytochrome P450 [Sporichthyaceae bacterium]|nr:cytochrome P450 [Sporichthyaceae bacterium]
MNPVGEAKSFVRWGGRYGLTGAVLRAGARKGDLHSRMVTDPAARANPYPIYDAIRARGPVSPTRFGLISVDHTVISEVLRNEDFRSGFPTEALSGPIAKALAWARDPAVLGPVAPPSLLATDGPQHARYRRLVSRAFTARAVDALAGDVERKAVDLLDRLNPSGPVDLIAEYAARLPVQVISGVLGVPVAMQDTFLRWGQAVSPGLDIELDYRTFRGYEAALRELHAWLLQHFEALRREPGDDLLSRVIVAARAESGPELDDSELTSLAGLVLAAGFETTVNLIGNAVVLLMSHPDQLDLLRAEPTRWANAVEEVLRFDSPVQNTGRHASRDTVLREVAVARNQFVLLCLAGANRDPGVFTEPDRFDVTRANAKDHLSFSAGSHYCLGAALARLEGEIGLRLLFERFGDLRVAGTPVRRPTRILRGWSRLPVRLDSSATARTT